MSGIKTWTSLSSLVDAKELKRMSWVSLFRPTWQTGYLLSHHTFTSDTTSRSPIHPLGIDLPWTPADADISAAVVISLSAAGKTARAFAYHMFWRNAAKEGPIWFLQISQTPELLESVPRILGTDIPTKAVRYDLVGGSAELIEGLDPKRIVLVDFGGRAGTLAQLIESIKSHSALGEVQTTIIHVGSEQNVYSADEIKGNCQTMQTVGEVQFNTCGVRDAVIE
ncbi:hypothetical protein PENSUB_4488 [Penicillium subrubescens]|uniref:Uncharacterized protein n=2 Tax=Penicillium subrubescens TaxID=1316194 RepID=A0A1Q5UCD4_9EURO|nr:hypothetical protein PENSUB_4488 [Penicillium subrubescens]